MTSVPKVVVVGEAWGEQEAKLHHALVGPSGIEFLHMLEDAGWFILTEAEHDALRRFWTDRDPFNVWQVWQNHPEFILTNVFNLRPPNNDLKTICVPKAQGAPGFPPLSPSKYLDRKYLGELTRLASQIAEARPNLIIALGNTATWALLRNTGITKIRGTVTTGTLVPGVKILPTYHPAAVLRQWNLRAVTVLDLAKGKRENAFAELRRPRRSVWIEPSLADLGAFWERHLRSARRISFDIETATGQITCIGFSPEPDAAIVVPFVDSRSPSGSYWQSAEEEALAWAFVRRVLDHPAPKIAQNGIYDLHFLWRGYGITVRNCEDDTMLLHHALQPESPKGLAFLGSVYTDEASWKLMRQKTETRKRDE